LEIRAVARAVARAVVRTVTGRRQIL